MFEAIPSIWFVIGSFAGFTAFTLLLQRGLARLIDGPKSPGLAFIAVAVLWLAASALDAFARANGGPLEPGRWLLAYLPGAVMAGAVVALLNAVRARRAKS
jgi:hypothetical protein